MTLTGKEQKRLKVITEVDAGRIKAEEAAVLVGLSLRQVRRLVAAYGKEAAVGLAHGNSGRPPANKTPQEIHYWILELARGP